MLRKHQAEGALWLARNPRGYLADAPRVGKTRTLLSAVAQSGLSHPLVVTPAIVRTHWAREADEVAGVHPTIKSYDEIRRGGPDLMRTLLTGRNPVDALILDEAHMLKHAVSQRTRMLFGTNGYARRMQYVWPASGTPISKSPGDLWTWLAAMHPQVLIAAGFRSEAQFLEHFAVMRYMGMHHGKARYKAVATKNEAEWKALVGPLMLRRTLADLGRDVPALDWQVVELSGTGAQAVFSEPGDVWRKIDMENLASIQNDPHIARMRRRLGELKAPLVAEMLVEQLQADESASIVVFAYHRSVLSALFVALEAAGIALDAPLTGDTREKDREIKMRRFQVGATRVFLGQTSACQMGIRLDKADTIVLVEPEWTADVNTQAAMRIVDADRPERKCVVQMIALADTLDEAIVRQNKREIEMQENLL